MAYEEQIDPLERREHNLQLRISDLEAALVRAEASLANASKALRAMADALSTARMEANQVSDPRN